MDNKYTSKLPTRKSNPISFGRESDLRLGHTIVLVAQDSTQDQAY